MSQPGSFSTYRQLKSEPADARLSPQSTEGDILHQKQKLETAEGIERAPINVESGNRPGCWIRLRSRSDDTMLTAVNARTVSLTALIVAGLAVSLACLLAVGVYRLGERVSALEEIQRQHPRHQSGSSKTGAQHEHIRSSIDDVGVNGFRLTDTDDDDSVSLMTSGERPIAVRSEVNLASSMSEVELDDIDMWTSDRIAAIIEVGSRFNW
jgi:hypothetical protein